MTKVIGADGTGLHTGTVMAKVPLHPLHPERTCWGCSQYCPADNLACANGTVRTMHPVELFGDDWLEWSTRKTARTIADDSDSQRP